MSHNLRTQCRGAIELYDYLSRVGRYGLCARFAFDVDLIDADNTQAKSLALEFN